MLVRVPTSPAVCVNANCVCVPNRALREIPGADIKFVSGGGEISGLARSWLKARTRPQLRVHALRICTQVCTHVHMNTCMHMQTHAQLEVRVLSLQPLPRNPEP